MFTVDHNDINRMQVLYDFLIIALASILATALAYHPYFFGDELWPLRYAVQYDYSFFRIFHELNYAYKPRLVFDSILAILGHYKAERYVYAVLISFSYIWINFLLYYIVTRIFNANRILALLLIATVITSRYGIIFYFDYNSGLLELLSTGAFFTCLLFIWFGLKNNLNFRFAVLALLFAVICVFLSERYIAGITAAALVVVFYEIFIKKTKNIYIIIWALSLFIIPLLLFFIANIFYNRSVLIGTANQNVVIRKDTIQCFLLYCYNLFCGGNYSYNMFWGTYKTNNSTYGFLISLFVFALTIIPVIFGFIKKKLNGNVLQIFSILFIILSLIAASSLPGTQHQHARWVFSAGILVSFFWIILFKDNLRYIPILVILLTNVTYIMLKNHNGMPQVNASRTANLIGSSLNGISPNGHSGIIIGDSDALWVIAGADLWTNSSSIGDTFSKISLKSRLQLEVYCPGRMYNPDNFDFALLCNRFDNPIYRYVPVNIAMIMGDIVKVETLPVQEKVFDRNQKVSPVFKNKGLRYNPKGNIIVEPGDAPWISIPASMLKGKIIVINIKSPDRKIKISDDWWYDKKIEAVKLDWYDMNDTVNLSSTKGMIEINNLWSYQKLYLFPPITAGYGHIHFPMVKEKDFTYEIQSIDLR